jgi:hypothetical protein
MLAIGLGPAGANPWPEYLMFTHVQPPDPTFCDRISTMRCDEIIQYTEATGQLEFDLFLWRWLGYSFDSLAVTATWPATWGFVEASLCNGGQGSIDVQGNRAVVGASWLPDCPQVADAFLVARFVLDVTENGEFEMGNGPQYLIVGCPPYERNEDLELWAPAEAGVECEYCYQDCDFDHVCRPGLSPRTLDITLPQGCSDRYTLTGYSGADPPEYMCPPSFSVTEGWMESAVEPLGEFEYRLTLTVHTQGLEPGDYSGWVTMEQDCRACTRVNLTVTDSQGIEEPDEPVPPVDAKTWGQIKTLYR